MRITFTGPDGQLQTVTDSRAQQSDKPAVAIPRERRPAGYLLIQFTA